jgi:hypothetical protein
MATKRFDKHLHILVTSEESEMLNELADREGLRPSDTIRQLIRRAHAAAFGEKPSKARKRK